MQKRSPFFLATGLAVFVMMLACAITFSLAWRTISPEAARSDQVVDTGVSGSGGAGSTIDSSGAPLLAPPAKGGSDGSPAQPEPISAQRAARIALSLVPGAALLQVPLLVNYEGRMAYEVQISGGILYLDAFSGNVLGVLGTGALASGSQAGPNGNAASDLPGSASDQTVVTRMPGTFGAPSGESEFGENESNDDDENENGQEHHNRDHHDDDEDQVTSNQAQDD